MSLGLDPGRRVWLDGGPLRALEDKLVALLDVPDVVLAIGIGTPGAYRKDTLQVMTAGGRVIAYAKIADQPLAREALANEARMLSRAGAMLGEGAVPAPLGSFQVGGIGVLVISAGPRKAGPRRLGVAHKDFLDRLHLASAARAPFAESALCRRLADGAANKALAKPWRQRCAKGLDRLKADFDGVAIPLVMAHGDFVPWNTARGRDGLYVYDWENAATGMTPLYDAFHFEALPAALAGRAHRPDESRFGLWLAELWPQGAGRLQSLYLAYLLDMGLYYARAGVAAPVVGERGVESWFAARLDAVLDK